MQQQLHYQQHQKPVSRAKINQTELSGQQKGSVVDSTTFRAAGTAASGSSHQNMPGAQSMATLHQSEILSQLQKADSFFSKNRKSKEIQIPKPFDHRQR